MTHRRHFMTIGVCWVALTATSQAQNIEAAPWHQRLMPWESHLGDARPWRRDARLMGHYASGYNDDLQVLFPNPDSATGGQDELLWVRVTAFDAPRDLFLGILLNQPHALRTVTASDNVVFRVDSSERIAIAVTLDGRYDRPGWPTTRSPAFAAGLRDGIRAYRDGTDRHDTSGIARCITTLTPLMQSEPRDVNADERLAGHYVLGRCLAERYATRAAMEQFRDAIAIDSADADSHMALLAELSVLTHDTIGALNPAEEARWDQSFIDELTIVRARFLDYPGVRRVLDADFDPRREADLDAVQRASLPRLRRVGYAIFRWKQR